MLWGQRTGPGHRPAVWSQTWNITLCLWLPFSLCLVFLAFSLLTGTIVSSYNICSTLGGLAVLFSSPLVSSKKQIFKNDSLILIKEELYFLTLHDKASSFKGICLNWHPSLDVSVTQQVLQITNLLQFKLVFIPVHSQIPQIVLVSIFNCTSVDCL